MLMNFLRWLAAVILKVIPANKPLGRKLFEAVALHSVGVAIESVLYRIRDGQIQVYLTQRDDTEAYGGQWHFPGSFIRAGETLRDVFNRLGKKEFMADIARWKFVTDEFFGDEERYATMLDRVYIVEMDGGEPANKKGGWYDINDLPANTVAGHLTFILPAAVKAIQSILPEKEIMTTNEVVEALENLDPASEEFKGAVAQLLKRIDPTKPLGTALFNAIARLSVNETFEAALLRERNGRTEIYLITRSMTDTAYPGESHIPGSSFRPGEKEAEVAARLGRNELKCRIVKWECVGNLRFTEARGWYNSLIYLVEVDGEPQSEKGAWYPVDQLPSNLVAHHADPEIPFAIAAYRLRQIP